MCADQLMYYTMIALFVCFSGVECRYVNGPYYTVAQCVTARDAMNQTVKRGEPIIYECRQKTAPTWMRVPEKSQFN